MATWLDRIRPKMKKRTEKVDPDGLTAKLSFGVRTLTLHEQVALMLRSSEFEREMRRSGKETEEEANDFDVPDELPITSPHEYTEMQEDDDMRVIAAGDPRSVRSKSKKPRAKPEVDEEPEEGTSSDEN